MCLGIGTEREPGTIRNLIATFFAYVLLAGVALAACREDSVSLRGDWGQARFSIEVADTAQERSRGLMHREHMAQSAGMLFIYPRSQRVAFWMRNTLIPLDMIFIDETGVVANVHSNAIPHDETGIPSDGRVLMVLEINGGLARAMGIAAGSQVQHPRLKQSSAVWPC